MITPELQNYINQSRAAGQTDEQIRQTLSTRGWVQADLDAAFGTATTGTSKFPKWAIWLIVLLVLLPMLFWGVMWGLGVYGVYKLRNIVPDSLNGYNDSTKNEDLKVCGNWPEDDSIAKQDFVRGTLTRNGIADGFPIYPSAFDVGYIKSPYPDLAGEIEMCSSDDPQRVTDFYLGEASKRGWTFKTWVAKGNPFDKGAVLIGEPDSKNGSFVILNIFRDADHTVIKIQYYNDLASTESQTGNQESSISKNNCGFTISPPKGWSSVNSTTFKNDSLGSEIKLSCKQDGFEDNYYVLFTPAQSLMTKPDSGFYVTSAENTMVGNRKAYLFREEHKTGGVENYELVLMIDSGIKNASKNQMDIIYAYMPGKYKAQYEASLKDALYSYKR